MTRGALNKEGRPANGMGFGWRLTWGLGALILVSPVLSIMIGAEEGSMADNFLFSLFALGCLGFPTMLLIMLVLKSFKSPTSDSVRIGTPPVMMGAAQPQYGAGQFTQKPPSVSPMYSQVQTPYQGESGGIASTPVKKIEKPLSMELEGNPTQVHSAESLSELQKRFCLLYTSPSPRAS